MAYKDEYEVAPLSLDPQLGPWFRPVFRLLRAMKVLRGTPLDPFGRTGVRRLERELITEYRAAVQDLLACLTEDTLADCARIAALPDLVRGYEQIKIAS